MKNFAVLLIFCLTINAVAFGQSTPTDKVLAAFSSSELAELSAEDIEVLNFLAENMCIVSDNGEKAGDLPDFLSLGVRPGVQTTPEITNDGTFNPLLWNVNVSGENQYFRVGDTNLTVMVLSQARLDVLYQRYKANQK